MKTFQKSAQDKIASLALTTLDGVYSQIENTVSSEKIMVELLIEQWLEDQDAVRHFLERNPALENKIKKDKCTIEQIVTRLFH